MSSPVLAFTLDLLVDTHMVIWLATDPDRIPSFVLDAVEKASHRFVSHITALEIQIKHQKSPDDFDFSLEHYEASMKEFGMEELAMNYSDIKKQDSMEFLHRDPFDRMLMAQACTRNLRLVTHDEKIVRTAHRFKEFSVLAV